MAETLALFPLQLVVFPKEDLNLHIFEPRYKELMRDCEVEGITFGIPSYVNGQVMPVGTEMELAGINRRYPNGELDVVTKARATFRILDFYPKLPDKLYAGASIERLTFDQNEDLVQNESILELVRELFGILNVAKDLPETVHDFRTYDIAHFVGFSLEQEYDFLTQTDAHERQRNMLLHLQQVLPVVREMENLRQRARMNGHFKNFGSLEF